MPVVIIFAVVQKRGHLSAASRRGTRRRYKTQVSEETNAGRRGIATRDERGAAVIILRVILIAVALQESLPEQQLLARGWLHSRLQFLLACGSVFTHVKETSEQERERERTQVDARRKA